VQDSILPQHKNASEELPALIHDRGDCPKGLCPLPTLSAQKPGQLDCMHGSCERFGIISMYSLRPGFKGIICKSLGPR
jgi:hypothetical protein